MTFLRAGAVQNGGVSRNAKIIAGVVGLALLVVIALRLAAPRMQESFFYPEAPPLPAVVSERVGSLLARLEATLRTNAPAVLEGLQPGLSDAEIRALELKGGFQLSDDLRALYRWRNGAKTNSLIGLIPGQHFVPLEWAVSERAMLLDGEGQTATQRAAMAMFTAHMKNWIHILNDGAGDGYFFDPTRPNAPFFYHMAEAGHYLWFPSVKNFLAAAIECYEIKVFKPSADGSDVEEDYDQSGKIWERYGRARVEE